MKSIKKTGHLVGLILLATILFGAPGVMLRGLSTSQVAATEFLSFVMENATQMRLAILLDVLASTLSVALPIVLFPILKAYRRQLAFWYFGLYLTFYALIWVGNISHLSLISLSEMYTQAASADAPNFRLLGMLLVEDYYWSHFITLILFSSAAFLLYYTLLKTKLVPAWLAVWGLVAVGGVFAASWSNIFGQSVPFIIYGHNGLHLITLTIWLLIKGFSTKSNLNIGSSLSQ